MSIKDQLRGIPELLGKGVFSISTPYTIPSLIQIPAASEKANKQQQQKEPI
jgi:hypothetical protein